MAVGVRVIIGTNQPLLPPGVHAQHGPLARRAFTIGNRESYDKALAESDPVHKIGARPAEGYPGGWVWRTRQEADAFLASADLPWEGAVYGLDLPTGWDADVTPEPGEDGVHHLLNDAVIVSVEAVWSSR